LLDVEALKNLLHQSGFSKTDKLLLCAAFEVRTPKSVAEIKEIAKRAGFRQTDKWNVSSLLSGSGGLAIRTDSGWELTNSGKERVAQLGGSTITAFSSKVASSLRSHLASVSNHETAEFLDEAIRC
jgi:hypothetical protein